MDSNLNDRHFLEYKNNRLKPQNIHLLNNIVKLLIRNKQDYQRNSKENDKWKYRKYKTDNVIRGKGVLLTQKIISIYEENDNNQKEVQNAQKNNKSDVSNNNDEDMPAKKVSQADFSDRKKLTLTDNKSIEDDKSPAIKIEYYKQKEPNLFYRICCCSKYPPRSEEEIVKSTTIKKPSISYDSFTLSTDGLSLKQGRVYNISESTGYRDLFSENSQSSRYTLARHINNIRGNDDNDKSKISTLDTGTDKSTTILSKLDEELPVITNKVINKSQLLIQKRKLVKEIEMPNYNDTNGDPEDVFLDWLKVNMGAYEYKYTGFLGEGTFGKVWSCKDIANSDERVALKITKRAPKYRKLALHEVHMLLKVLKNDSTGKKHIILFKGYFKVDRHFIIIFPLYGDNLYQYLKSIDYLGMRLDDVYLISFQLWEAVEYLHNLMICHTDIKPENLLLLNREYKEVPCWTTDYKYQTVKVPAKPNVVLIDLGNAVSDMDTKPSLIVTRYYRPPEVYLELGWDETADIWSIGCVMYELYCGKSLFQCRGDLEHMWMIEVFLKKFPYEDIKRSHLYKKFFDENGRIQTQSLDTNKLHHRLQLYKIIRDHTTQEQVPLLDLIDCCLAYYPRNRIRPSHALSRPIFDDAKKYFYQN